MIKTRNYKSLIDKKEEVYKESRIVAWKDTWEEYDEKKDKWNNKSAIICYLYRKGSKNQPLNLGECNDGSKFTAINQAINQAKSFINFFADKENKDRKWKTFTSKTITSQSNKDFEKFMLDFGQGSIKNVKILNRRKTEPKEAVWYMKIKEDDCTLTYSFDKLC
jgi:hypothetical protein